MGHVMNWKKRKESPVQSFPLAMAGEGESVRIVLIRGTSRLIYSISN